jgi:hypothetical protein
MSVENKTPSIRTEPLATPKRSDDSLNDKWLSHGIRHLGLEIVHQHLSTLVGENRDSKGLPIVSVGSGSGYVERLLQKRLGLDETTQTVICVDPSPAAFLGVAPKECGGIAPLCASVDELVELEPKLVDNCILLCNWPSPNDSSFDFYALFQLRPVHATFVIETTTGVAGGSRLHKFLHSLGVKTGGHFGFRGDVKELKVPSDFTGKECVYKVAWETHREGVDVAWNCPAILSVVTVTRDASRIVKPAVEIPLLLPGSFQLGKSLGADQGSEDNGYAAATSSLSSRSDLLLLMLLLKQLQDS